jgi:hypothetical protein
LVIAIKPNQLYKMNEDHRGIIFIVDISGYSRFVSETDNETGSMIVRSLLESIIRANFLAFLISEIEGDAVLFYRHGPAVPVREILSQFEEMLRAFRKKLDGFSEQFPLTKELSIKLVVHYGIIGGFLLDSYSKLFGQAVVEAHRLLKNSIGSHTYVLITKAYLDEQNIADPEDALYGAAVCELYDIGQLCYTYFDYPSDGISIQPSLLNQAIH